MKEIFYIILLQYILFFANISMLRIFSAVILLFELITWLDNIRKSTENYTDEEPPKKK